MDRAHDQRSDARDPETKLVDVLTSLQHVDTGLAPTERFPCLDIPVPDSGPSTQQATDYVRRFPIPCRSQSSSSNSSGDL